MGYVGLSEKEALELATNGAWRRYYNRIRELSTPQQDNDTDEPAAWEKLQSALAQIELRRAKLPKSRKTTANRRGL